MCYVLFIYILINLYYMKKICNFNYHQKLKCKFNRSFNINNNLSYKNYNSFSERPTNNLLTHFQIFESTKFIENFNTNLQNIPDILNTLNYLHLPEYTLPIVILSIGIRLFQIPCYYFIKKIYTRKNNNEINPAFNSNSHSHSKTSIPNPITSNFNLSKYYKEFIFNDFIINMKNHNKSSFQIKHYESYYCSKLFISWLIQGFMVLNNFRFLRLLEGSSIIHLTVSTVPGLHYFLTIFICNFLNLKTLKHPYLINFTDKQYLLVSFVLSLSCIFWSKMMCISWIAYSTTNIVINTMRNRKLIRLIKSKKYSNYLEKKYSKEIRTI